MQEKTILVIDDSSTIRRLVDRELSSAGYRVVMAENAEIGIETAELEKPDLILLDHQLPGTTGFKVCGQLLQHDELRRIPVVVSSTLRKKAYAEYTDCSNVVDMLPKPYTGDLLRTTVANALDTAALIVQSQSAGTAIPEVIDACGDADLVGTMAMFSAREVIDFLNNGSKHGALELECDRSRISVFLENGRIQAVTATGVEPADIAEQLPTALADLSPMMKFTISGKQSTQLDGLVELLNNKVLDARLLRQLLRHQAAVLLTKCFEKTARSFRFDAQQSPSTLFAKLPLDISLAALLVDACMLPSFSPPEDNKLEFSRKTLRGQNLDRAGLSAMHMKLLSALNRPMTALELTESAGCPLDETRRVLHGFELADLVSSQTQHQQQSLIALCGDAERAQQINTFLLSHGQTVQGRVVRDVLSAKLLMRKLKPDAMFVDLDSPNDIALGKHIQLELAAQLGSARWFGITRNPKRQVEGLRIDGLLSWDNLDQDLSKQLNPGDAPGPRSANPCQLAGCV